MYGSIRLFLSGMLQKHEIRLSRPLYNQMIAHLQTHYPLEACGILAGTGKSVTALYAIDNILKSPAAFEMDPHQQLAAMLAIEEDGQEMLAFFHSHPHGPERPSPTDVAQAYYPDSVTIIATLRNRDNPTARAFTIKDGRVTEIKLTIT